MLSRCVCHYCAVPLQRLIAGNKAKEFFGKIHKMDEIELVDVRIITATDSGSEAGQGTASKNEANTNSIKIKKRLKTEKNELNQSRIEDSAEFNEDRIITDATDYADLDQELGSPSKTKIKDFQYPQSVEQWWTRTNFVRITSWISFWLSLYYFTDAVKISGQNLFPNELNQDWRANSTGGGNFINTNSAATLMFAFIYLTVNNFENVF